MKKIFVILLAALVSFSVSAKNFEVIANVNGTAVTDRQVESRANLLIKSSGLEPTEDNKAKAKKDAFEMLVEEIIQKDYAEQEGIKSNDKDLELALQDLEKRNNLKPGGIKAFVEGRGISYNTFEGQLEASILWRKILEIELRRKISATDKEVKRKQDEISKKPKVTQVLLSEIVLPVEFENDKEVKDKADKIYNQLKNGADFESLAKENSQGRTAEKGGIIGWVDESGVFPAIVPIIKKLAVGEVSEPKKVESYYVIMKVSDRKILNDSSDVASIKNQVLTEKLEKAGKKLMADLRGKAFIEYKNGKPN